jgi:CubicO group peptidase (beta-lactamase class C family)
MRRVLTILTAIVLLLVSLGIGVFTADLPFWQRAFRLPLAGDATYLPVASMGFLETEHQAHSHAFAAGRSVIDPHVIDEAASRAQSMGSRALLIHHHKELVLARFFVADDPGTLMPATVVARPLVAMAVGVAVASGQVTLDEPVSRWLTEWEGEPRGKITLRQLLEETSGLETGGDLRRVLRTSPWKDLSSLPNFATSRGVRMLLGNDYQDTALGFRLDHEPGGFRNVSPANTQLAAVILERATGEPYERYVARHLWAPLDGHHAEMQLDRRAGMPAVHCCWRTDSFTILRFALMLMHEGRVNDRQVVPAGWIREMARPSRVSAGTGMQLNLVRSEGLEILESMDDDGSAIWVIPSRELVIVNIGTHGAGDLRELPGLILRGLPAT